MQWKKHSAFAVGICERHCSGRHLDVANFVDAYCVGSHFVTAHFDYACSDVYFAVAHSVVEHSVDVAHWVVASSAAVAHSVAAHSVAVAHLCFCFP